MGGILADISLSRKYGHGGPLKLVMTPTQSSNDKTWCRYQLIFGQFSLFLLAFYFSRCFLYRFRVSGSSIDFKEWISTAVLVQRVFNTLHDRENFLLFQPATNDLHSYRQSGHFRGIVMFVRTLGNAVQLLNVEVGRQLIFRWVDMGYRKNTCGVVQLQSC